MSDGAQHPEHKESFMNKILHPHHHSSGENEGQSFEDKAHESEGFHADLKKEEAKLKDYFKEDKKLEEEGQEYGGLM